MDGWMDGWKRNLPENGDSIERARDTADEGYMKCEFEDADESCPGFESPPLPAC